MIETKSKFTDRKGGVWTIVLTDEIVDRVKQRHGVDVSDEFNTLIGQDVPIERKAAIIFAVVEEALKARGLNEFSAQELFGEDEVLTGIEALTWAAVDFNDYTEEGLALMKPRLVELIEAARHYVKTSRQLKEAERIRDRPQTGLGIES